MPGEVPTNAGLLDCVTLLTRPGSLCEPRFPAAVAGGNVETSQRLVDLCFEALGRAGAEVPAESAGTMNNLSLGGYDDRRGEAFAFYETLGGGAGASAEAAGASGIQTHMTNTRNTPIEECRLSMPLVVERLALRPGTGGAGRHAGGDGLVKELSSPVRLSVSLLAERRRHGPAGRAGGLPGAPGDQALLHPDRDEPLPAKGAFVLEPGQRLRIETPGGGGFGPRVRDRLVIDRGSGVPGNARPEPVRTSGRFGPRTWYVPVLVV
ncbi:MAG: hydantoinase B/oxoprolinase family protein [Planctomycetota bacterium]